ncbi:MAG: response regulator transcription factor [Phycisphaerae bacterium]|nr:response regulator transcription factor [Phycisphaerae bacterium]
MDCMAQKRILIVEDEPDMAELVAMHLKREHYQPDIAPDGVRALEAARANPPALVLLDMMLPKLSGTEVLREMRQDPRTAEVPVIILTAKTAEGDIVAGLQLGADDYITKPFSISVLLARVSAVLRRAETSGGATDRVLTVGPIRINRDMHRVEVDGKPVSLTPTEFKLLATLVAARGRVMTRDQLINHVLGVNAVVTDRTIDVHLAALRRKLGAGKSYIETVRGIGYRIAVEQHETA